MPANAAACHALHVIVSTVERRRFRARGVVQGVGFRPFVHRLAHARGLAGFVLNDGEGVVIEAEGAPAALDAFAADLVEAAPALARVDSLVVERLEPLGESEFAIRLSRGATGSTAAVVPPDIATCEDCLRELFDPDDRRYRYPFLNCTQCGPRLTIVRSVPYDRARTTMASFELCADCRREYEDPADRRFHAEPIACPVCGPQLSLPLDEAVACLRAGGILAVKGLGGYHLACDARDEEAVARLRARKHREQKPLALMTGDPDALCRVEPEERVLLESPRPADRAHAPPAGRAGRGLGRARLAVARRAAPVHAAAPPALARPAAPLRAHERQPQRRADRLRRRRGAPAPRRHRRRVPRQRPPDPPPLRGLRRPAGRRAAPLPRLRAVAAAAAGRGARPAGRRRRRAQEHVLRRARRRGVPLRAPRRPRLRERVQSFSHRSRALPRDARRRACGGRLRPPPRVPLDEVGARAGAAARRGPASPRARRRVPGRARRGGTRARARLRRHRLRHRRDALGRRAAPRRPRLVRAARLARPRAASRRRSGGARAVADGGDAPRARPGSTCPGPPGRRCGRASP